MVVGLDKFKQYFSPYKDGYVIIGGTACDLIFSEVAIPFRATKDIDLVICVEVLDAAFADAFGRFLRDAGYERWSDAEGELHFFRFEKPIDKTFPHMIELFARPSTALKLPDSNRFVRLDVEDAKISLSALLLDKSYFEALKSGARLIEEVPILDEKLLIAFKAKAFLDLTERRARGELVKGDDIKKHRHDIFRLLQLIDRNSSVPLAESIKEDLRRSVAILAVEEIDPPQFGVQISRDEGIAILSKVYGL